MAIISGTLGSDILIGTAQDDILSSLGTYDTTVPEYVSGLDGADQYSMYRVGGDWFNYIIDDQGTDGAHDSIIGARDFYQVTNTGIETFGAAERVGDDLFITLPSKAWGIRDPFVPETNIKIVDQYGDGQIESIDAGNVTYSLVTGAVGTGGADVMAGSDAADRFVAGKGNDWVFGNGGKDRLDLGGGNDMAFGGTGRDVLLGRRGDDRLFGDGGNDRLFGGGGDDQIDAGTGNDMIRAGTGTNMITTAAGADTLVYAFKPGKAATHDNVTDFDIAMDHFDFTRTPLGFSDLTIGSTSLGDATITWDSNAAGQPDIYIELSGVTEAEVTADLFVFG